VRRFQSPLALAVAVALVALAAALPSCRAVEPTNRPVAACERACAKRATQCSAAECNRGCEFILDRLAEGLAGEITRCVGKLEPRACKDEAWAHCAVRVGPHADGGPPAPPPPSDEWD
jgi:hypothetical protein